MLLNFWHYYFIPVHGPWWMGAVWGNVVAIVPCGILAWLWATTKFWPLHLVHRKLDGLVFRHDEHAAKLDYLTESLQALHEKHDRLLELVTQVTSD